MLYILLGILFLFLVFRLLIHSSFYLQLFLLENILIFRPLIKKNYLSLLFLLSKIHLLIYHLLLFQNINQLYKCSLCNCFFFLLAYLILQQYQVLRLLLLLFLLFLLLFLDLLVAHI